MKLVEWFPEYHRAVAQVELLEMKMAHYMGECARLQRENDVLRASGGNGDFISQFQNEVLVDQPFEGPIPAGMWLSPGENERVKEDQLG